MLKRSAIIAAVCMLLFCMLAGFAFADDTCSISVSPNLAPLEITKGGREQVDLTGIFTDSKGHDLTYTLDEAEESLKARIKSGILLIDPLELGSFEVKLTAKCEASGEEKQIVIPVSIVESEDQGNPAQYGYDETPAESVTVYFTISSDGIPLMGNDADNTVLAHLKVEVPYFDLGLYGLEKYYRYHTENGRGKYVDDEVVERPTAMHLMIYMTERYYMGLPEDMCCKGTSGILEYNTPTTMRNMFGNKAYDGDLKAYYLTGSATSTYMANLWGHDENLMYYRNHLFPLMSPGWGSTSDYQLLSEGNTFDLAMYTNWSFYNAGAFCCFDRDAYQAGTGELLLFSTMKAGTSEFGSGELTPISGLSASVYDEEWNQIDTIKSSTAGFGYVFNEPGTYYILGLDPNAGTNQAGKAPANAVVTIKDSFKDYAFSKITDQDGGLLPKIEQIDDIEGTEHYHVSVPQGTTEVKVTWPGLPESAHIVAWDIASGAQVQLRSAGQIEGEVITLDPTAWEKNGRAALLMDSQGNPLGAFTFGFYTPEGINFPPSLKSGVKPLTKASWREKKDYNVKLSDIFVDYDGDEMTYQVSVDGDEEREADVDFVYRDEQPGQHTLVFTATDSKGKTGEKYTLELKLTANQAPELADSSAKEKEVSIRYDEQAKINLMNVFRDFDDDHVVYLISRDGGESEEFDPEEITEYGDYINPTYREFWQARNFIYKPSGMEDIGTHVFRIMAKDDLDEGTEVFTYTVHVTDDQAPVPAQESYVDYCMLHHYWMWDYRKCFTDPEGDKMTYTYSINGGAEMPCDTYRTGDQWNIERIPIEREEPFVVTFYAKDVYGKTGSFTVNVYPTPEVLHELEIRDNRFDASADGKTVYDVQNGFPATWIMGFDISKNVTLRGVRYSEENGHFNYYLDVDCFGMDESDVFDMVMRSQPSGEGYYIGPSFGKSYYNENHVALQAADGVTEGILKWNNQREEFNYLQIAEHWRWYRIYVNVTESSEAKPEELTVESQEEGLYQGELTDRSIVKARYSDGVTRYVNGAEISPAQFDKAGTQTLSAEALGLSGSSKIDVMEAPSYMTILNDKGKYGRLRLIRVTDEDGEPIEGAEVTCGDPEINESFSYDTYDDFADRVKKTYDLQVRLPMEIESDAKIRLEFEMLKDEAYAINLLRGDNVTWSEEDDVTTGIATIQLEEGKAQGAVDWIDRHDQYVNGSHAYDRFNFSVKTGACEIIGKVSSWDEKDNTEFLAYPADLTDAEIRADAMGSRNKTYATSAVTGEAVKADGRYERTFTVEGLDAGKYKLAVVKPGKYVVTVNEAELDGTADLGTITLRLFGDINNDGKVRAGDATQVCRYIAGNRSFTEEESLAADITQDGKVRAGDATQICRYIAGNTSMFDTLN